MAARPHVRIPGDKTQAGSGRSESRKKGHLEAKAKAPPTPDRMFAPLPVGVEEELEAAIARPAAPESLRGPNPDDRFAPLVAEHAEVHGWLEDLQQFVGTTEERWDRWNRVATAIEAHARAEEWAFYPRVRRLPVTRDMARAGLVAHARIRELTREIDAHQADDPDYRGLLAELARVVEAHVEMEEQQLMPLAVQVLGKGPVDELVAAYVRQRRKLEDAVEEERVRPGKRGKRIGRSNSRVRHPLD